MTLQCPISDAHNSEDLVNRILLGDKSAETEMVHRYHDKLFNRIFSQAKSRELTEDIVQDTWVIALEKIRGAKLKNKKKLGSYIFRIGTYQLIMSFRSNEKINYQGGHDVLELPDESADPERTHSNSQFSKIVLNLLANMPVQRDSELLYRFYLIGDTKQELCEEFGLRSSHFDRVIFRARERYKKAWENLIKE